MRKEIRFTVAGKPQALDRSRQASNGHRFDTEKNRYNKAVIRMKAEKAAEDEGCVLPLPANAMGYTIVLYARFKPPKSYSKKRLRAIEEGRERPRCKPDVDNIQKLYFDALKGILEDDKDITSVSCQKRFYERDEVECLIMWEEDDG